MYPSTTIAVPKKEIKEAARLVFVKLAPSNGVQKEITFIRRITYNSSFSSKRMIFHRYLEHATNVKKKLSITSDAIDHGATEPLYFPLDLKLFFCQTMDIRKSFRLCFIKYQLKRFQYQFQLKGFQ